MSAAAVSSKEKKRKKKKKSCVKNQTIDEYSRAQIDKALVHASKDVSEVLFLNKSIVIPTINYCYS